MNKSTLAPLLVVLCFLLPLFSLAVYGKSFETLDRKALDLYQHVLPSTKLDDHVVMINIDDATVDAIGAWPFSRDVYVTLLETLKDLDARAISFDLNFLDASPAQVDEDYVTNGFPESVRLSLETVADELDAVMGEDPETAKQWLYELLADAQESILLSASSVLTPIDEQFADALADNGRAYLTLTMSPEQQTTPDDFPADYVALKNITVVEDDRTPEYTAVMPPLSQFVESSASCGFVNANPDRDGYTRRIHLLMKYNGQYYGQFAFVPVLAYLGNPQILVSNAKIVLQNAHMPDGTVKDITVPRGLDGSVLLKFPKTQYVDYRAVSLRNINRLPRLTAEMNSRIAQMADANLFMFLDDGSPAEYLSVMSYLESELACGEDEEYGITWRAFYDAQRTYYASLETALSADYEHLVLNYVAGDDDLTAFVTDSFALGREAWEEYVTSYETVAQLVRDSICIVGTCASSTSDYGLILYEEQYPNPGVHYTLANQFLSDDFIGELSPRFSVFYAMVLCLILMAGTSGMKKTGAKVGFGLLIVLFSIGSTLLFFILTRQYLGVVIPLFATAATYIYITVSGFIKESRGKRFITNAFGQCLSKEVVKEIVEHPESFKLGGQKLEMTAIFTDIQKFSSFSELLTAGQLVALLNYYLTEMSDIIMAERGTVDKYEGDAIIALVGAPVQMDDHAERAVRAALTMKQTEIGMNEYIRSIAAGEKPESMDQDLYDAFTIMVANGKSIFTRIGLNSGEMVAGYMGSENKKNYTMMGSNVNLASRLEGVNKQYSTGGILFSEATRNLLGPDFLVRRLDRVQVVNVKTPVRLYEPLGLRGTCASDTEEYIQNWEHAMDLFEAGVYAEALAAFKRLQSQRPDDQVAAYYIALISDFFLQGKVPTEEDGRGVVYNRENGAFRLLSK